MVTSSLPVELQDLIIDEIGGELKGDAEDNLQRSVQRLHACALVCRHWHIYSLPYIFGSVDLVTNPISRRHSTATKQLERLKRLLKVLDSNPFIRRCIKSLAFTPHIGWADFDEQMVKLAHHRDLIQHLTFIDCRPFRTSSLAKSANLKSITFEQTRDAIADHGEDFHPYASLQKLVLIDSEGLMGEMESDGRFGDLFCNIQHLEITLGLPFTHATPPQWQGSLKWENLLSLSLSSWVSFPLNGLAFASFFAKVPWSSFDQLATLNLCVETYGPQFWESSWRRDIHWCEPPSPPRFLSEASHLARLRALNIAYRFKDVFSDEAWLGQGLRDLYGECLNPTFGESSGFPALEFFSTSIVLTITPELSARGIDKVGLLARMEDQLSSVFGRGGRAEMDGWKTDVEGELYVKIDPNYVDLSDCGHIHIERLKMSESCTSPSLKSLGESFRDITTKTFNVVGLACKLAALSAGNDTWHNLNTRQHVERLKSFVQLMDSNPHIGESVRSVEFAADREEPELDEAVYQAALHLQLVTNLTVVAVYNRWFAPRPFFKDTISLLLRGAQLQHLTFIRCTTFKTSSIATCSSLESLTIENSQFVAVDHAGDPGPIPSLRKLDLSYSGIILETMRSDPRLRSLFGNVQDLNISLGTIFAWPPTVQETSKLTNIHSLTLACCVDFPIDENFGSTYFEFPWSSFPQVATLSINVQFRGDGYRRPVPHGWFRPPSVPLILSGASHLEHLRTLKITYHFTGIIFDDEVWLDRSFLELYGECLNPTFEQRARFPSLKSFSTTIYMVTSAALSQSKDKAGLLARTMEYLPSIFGPGGRAEVDGWKTEVNVNVSVNHKYVEA